MRIRWTIAALGTLALALLTLNVPLPWLDSDAAADAVCDVKAKPAKLNFTVKDLDNNNVKLADFKGKVILLDFWATWCGPCKVEIPGFIALQTKYGKDGLQVLGFSVDDPLKKLKPFAAEMKMNYPVLQGLGHEDVQDAYGPLWSLPVGILISRDGKVCKKHTGMTTMDVFEKEIKSLL